MHSRRFINGFSGWMICWVVLGIAILSPLFRRPANFDEAGLLLATTAVLGFLWGALLCEIRERGGFRKSKARRTWILVGLVVGTLFGGPAATRAAYIAGLIQYSLIQTTIIISLISGGVAALLAILA